MTKEELRESIKKEIAALPDGYISDSDKGLYSRIISLSAFTEARTVMMYYSVGREPGTHGIAAAAMSLGKTVAFPYCYKGGIMEARAVESLEEMVPAVLGIPAPRASAPVLGADEFDLIIVPALACSVTGFRIGYGGGYYDRYLKDTGAYTIGLTRERLLRETLPAGRHDIAVRCIVTEERTLVLQ